MSTVIDSKEQEATKAPVKVRGYTLVAKALIQQGVDTAFYIMGGPMQDVYRACIAERMKMIDVRHEQAAAMSAHAYARVLNRPGVCLSASGPAAANIASGLASAWADRVPVVALSGASAIADREKGGAFQEIDQIAMMQPVTKWAERIHDPKRIPFYIDLAFREAVSGKPGPVYLDLPSDILYGSVDENAVEWPRDPKERAVAKPGAPPEEIERLVGMLQKAKRPIVVTGSGILWSGASAELQRFVEATGIPFYTTPQGRGVIPEDHEFFYAEARNTAMREADFVLVVAARLNYMFTYGKPPRFSDEATFARIDIDPEEINSNDLLSLGIVADANVALGQLRLAAAGKISPASYAPWRDRLKKREQESKPKNEAEISTDQMPIHPHRLCKEIRDFIDRDAILCVDGQQILSAGRTTIPSYVPGHRLNSGTFGTMGVGMPFGVGAKAAKPDKQVIVLHGDGSFGMNAMELDTAIRHNLPILVVISLNGGWSSNPDRNKPGRDLGYTRFDKIAEILGAHGEYVERPEDIRPALERAGAAVKAGKCALVNVVTDPYIATTWERRGKAFTAHMT